jgi:hypothetical protein
MFGDSNLSSEIAASSAAIVATRQAGVHFRTRSLMADLNSFWQRSVNAQRGRLYADGSIAWKAYLAELNSYADGWPAIPSSGCGEFARVSVR